MPWQELLPVDLRMQFANEWDAGCWSMTELCADYRISRKTGYKWLQRYELAGFAGLHDQSRRPHHSPQATDPALVEQLVTLRIKHPTWGARKLLAVARRRDPDAAWPSRSAVCDLLNARALIRRRPKRYRRVAAPTHLVPITGPNQTWTADFKGHFRTGDRRYCYPLTIRDGFSRYVLRCDAQVTTSYAATQPHFERAFAEYGLPDRIRSDNGEPFASTGFAGLSRLSVWWMRLGIHLERIKPAHPEENGSHEQFHRVLKAETARPPAATAAAQQDRFDPFRREYNEVRPHETLADDVPATYYRPSPRRLPARLPPLEYPGHWEVRSVSPGGQITWRGGSQFISHALAGERIALEEVDEGLWTIHFATVALGRFNERERRIYPIAVFTPGRSASFAGSAPVSRKGE
jgi:transposase InsO family protein